MKVVVVVWSVVVVEDGVLVDWELKVVVVVDLSVVELEDGDGVLVKVVVVVWSVVVVEDGVLVDWELKVVVVVDEVEIEVKGKDVMVIPVVDVDDGALDVLHPLSVDICSYVALLLSKFSFAVPYNVIALIMNSFRAELIVFVPIDSSIVMISLTRVIRDSSSPIIRSNE